MSHFNSVLTAYGRRWPETEFELSCLGLERHARGFRSDSGIRRSLLVEQAGLHSAHATLNDLSHRVEASISWARHELACWHVRKQDGTLDR